MGRKRKFDTNADRQAIYRVNKNARDAHNRLLAIHARRIVEAMVKMGFAGKDTPDSKVLEKVEAVLLGEAML